MTAPVALALPTTKLSEDEQKNLSELSHQLGKLRSENLRKKEYYEAKRKREDLRISIPPSLEGLEVAVGWPAAAVDCVEERLDFEAWLPGTEDDPKKDPFELEQVYLENDLDVESIKVHLDALTYGVGFAAVTTGEAGVGEADPLITIESPLNMTTIIDPRTRRISAAWMQHIDRCPSVELSAVGTVTGSLMLPNETILLEADYHSETVVDHATWRVLDRDQHNLGRVTVAQFVNRPRSGTTAGRSEITETVRRLTQSGMRTLAAAEIAREFYAAPQRYVLGAKETFFTDKEGNPIPAWKSYMGRLLALERDEYGDLPDVKEFRGQGLESFFGLMKTLAQILSGESGIPQNYLGFSTDQPPSADAIGAMEHRLVKRAERRQREFGRGWTEIARLAIMVRDGKAELPKEAYKIRPKWRDAHTPTAAAQADATTKLVGAKILPPNSRVTWDRVGIPREDQKVIEGELRRQSVTDSIVAMRGTGAGGANTATGGNPSGSNVVQMPLTGPQGGAGASGAAANANGA